MNLATTYMGFELPHPVVPGAGPFADSLDTVRRLEDAGAPLIVMPSLFEEQVAAEEVKRIASEEMGGAFALDPPLAVDVGIGSDWLAAK